MFLNFLKNWKTTLLGAAYAVLVLVTTEYNQGSIDWLTIIQAALGALMGFSASDNLAGSHILESAVLNWKTTMLGLTSAVFMIITEESKAHPITGITVLKAVGVALLGLLTNDVKKGVSK